MTETVTDTQTTLYIVHEIIYRQGRPIICCDAYAEDGERVCQFDAATTTVPISLGIVIDS